VKLILQNKDIEALATLGLTTLQAKVYLTLAKMEEANIITVSKATNIARQEIYRVINELQNRCLIEKILARPVRYRAIPITEAVPHLLMRVNEERLESHNKVIQFLERHRHKKPRLKFQENAQKFLLIPEKTSLSRRINQEIAASQKNIKIVMPSKKFVPALFDLSAGLKSAVQRGVTVKWVINKRLDPNGKPAILENLSKLKHFQLKYVPEVALLTFGLYDENTVIVASDSQLNYVESQALWTNAVPFVKLASNYFDNLWNLAQKA
jgi:sugar-specific transcriptional regulator TrmB